MARARPADSAASGTLDFVRRHRVFASRYRRVRICPARATLRSASGRSREIVPTARQGALELVDPGGQA